MTLLADEYDTQMFTGSFVGMFASDCIPDQSGLILITSNMKNYKVKYRTFGVICTKGYLKTQIGFEIVLPWHTKEKQKTLIQP